MPVATSPAFPSRRAAALLATLFGVLALAYAFTTPVFEAPDESLHFFYAHHLRAGCGLPVLPHGPNDGWGQEGAQPPLAYALFALPAFLAPADVSPVDLLTNPYAVAGRLAAPDNINWYIPTPAPASARLTLAVRAMRLVSVLAGVTAVLGAVRLAGLVLPDPRLALAAAAVMAFTPQFLFLSGAVTNDIVTVALATWALALAGEHLVMPLGRGRLLLLGLLCGLLPLAKVSGGIIAAAAVAAVALAPHSNAGGRLRQATGVAALAALVSGWWPLRNLLLYGDPLALTTHLTAIGHRPEAPSLLEFLTNGEFTALLMSYWGLFGWQSVPLPPPVYLALAALSGIAITGLLALFLRRSLPLPWGADGKGEAREGGRGDRSLFRSPAVALLIMAAAALVLAGVWSWNTRVYAAQGRLLFPALAPLSILLTAGLAALAPPRWRRVPPRAAAAGLFLLSTATPFAVIAPRYAPPPVRPAPPDAPALAVYDDTLMLESVRLSPDEAVPGAPVIVELAWRAARPLTENYAIGVQIVTPDWEPLARRDSFPGGGLTATSLWPPGVTVTDRHPLVLSPAAARPQQAKVAVTVYDRRTGDPLPAADAAGAPQRGGAVAVAALRIPPAPAGPAPDRNVLAAYPGLGLAVALPDGLPGATPRGSDLAVPVQWQVAGDGPRDRNLHVSLQLLDGAGVLCAQQDGAPMGGRFPTAAWEAGDVLNDTLHLPLPAGLPAGTYRLLLILYDPATGQRQPAAGEQTGAVMLGTVSITESRGA